MWGSRFGTLRLRLFWSDGAAAGVEEALFGVGSWLLVTNLQCTLQLTVISCIRIFLGCARCNKQGRTTFAIIFSNFFS